MKNKVVENLKTEKKEAKIDIIFWLILIVSIIAIFSKFIMGEEYYMYLDSGLDIVNQYYPYYINEILNIKDGNFSVWNFDYGFGTSIFNVNAWTMDIFGILLVLIGLIFGVSKIHYLLVWMQILKIIVIYILSKKFLAYFIKDKTARCLSAYLSTFSGYFFLWGQHFFLGTACVYLLLMLISVEKVIRNEKNGHILLSFIVAVLLIFSYYIGYMILIVGGAYFVYRYFSFNKEIDWKKLFKSFGKCAYCVGVGILLSGIILIPSCYNLLSTSSRLSTTEGSFIKRIIESFGASFEPEYLGKVFSRLVSNNILFTPSNPNYYEEPQFFCTMFILFFILQWIIYEFKQASAKKDYILISIKFISLYLLIFNQFSGLVFNAFAYPIYRYTYIVFPFLGIIIGSVYENVIKENKINLIGLVISFVCTLVVVWYSKGRLVEEEIQILNNVFICVIIGFVILFIIRFSSKYQNIFSAVFVVVLIASSCYDNYITTNHRWIVQKDEYKLAWEDNNLVNNTGIAISWLKENDKSFYRIEKNYVDFSELGDPFIDRVSTTLWYNSTMNYGMLDFYKYIYPNADVQDSIKLFKLENDMDLQALTVANSKYILSDNPIEKFDALQEVTRVGNIYVYKNTQTEQIAKFYTKTITSDEYKSLNDAQKSSILYNNIILDGNTPDVDINASAKINDFYLESQTYLHGTVESQGNGILMLAIPYQDGWNVFIDGEEVEQYQVDFGLIGIYLKEGNHNIELKYEVPKIKEGMISSIIGIFGLVILCFVEMKNKKSSL